MEANTYNQGDRVHFDNTAGLEGFGFIRGIAIAGVPMLGSTYIIEPDDLDLTQFGYQYSHFVLAEFFLTKA